MSKNYIDFFDLYRDLDAYNSIRSNEQLTLAHIPAVAQNKWTWIVANWRGLKELFKEQADGEDQELQSLESFDADVMSYKLGNTKNNPLENKEKLKEYNKFLDQIVLSSLNLSPEESQAIGREIERIQSLDIEDFESMKKFMDRYISTKAMEVGLGDPMAAKLYGVQVIPKNRSATTQDVIELSYLQELVTIIENIMLDLKQRIKRPPNLLSAANNNMTADSGITISDSYLSFVTTPYEISLEHMAKLYLGSESLWYELVTVNNLKPPFIDEIGTKLNIVAPPAVNNLTISTSKKDEIFVGSKIGIGSYRYKEETRVVEKIVINENNTMLLFVSGNQDINRFLPSEGGFVRIYKPSTIRSGQFIKIPTNNPGVMSSSVPTPTSDVIRRLGAVLVNFGVDVLRDEKTNDFVLDANGNFKMAYGYTNVRQTALYALKTDTGELPFHPSYGVNQNMGEKFFGTADEAVVFSEAIRSSLLTDPRFSNVEISNLAATGNSINLSLNVYITGSNQPISLNFIG